MYCVCQTADLKKALHTLRSFIVKRAIRPVLGHTHIQADGDRITLSATNLEDAATINIPADCEQNGRALPPALTLSHITQQIKTDEVTLRSKNEKLIVSAGSAEWELPQESLDEFPTIDTEPQVICEVDQSDFIHFAKAAHATSAKNAVRYELCTCEVRAEIGKLIITSTDGSRLLVSEMEAKTHDIPDGPAHVPTASLTKSVHHFGAGQRIEVGWNHKYFFIQDTSSNATFCLTQSQAPFPRYQPILDTKRTLVAQLNLCDMLQACKQAHITADTESGSVDLEVLPQENSVVFKSRSTIGKSQTSCDASVHAKKNQKITICATRMLTTLQRVPSGDIELYIQDHESPLEIKGSSYRFIMAPMISDWQG